MKNLNKFLILSTIITLVIGISFSVYKFYRTKQELQMTKQQLQILELEKSESYFNKKIECEKYTKLVKEEIDERRKGMFADLFGSEFLQMVFYSPKEDSCLYIIERLPDREYFIYNALTHHKITSFRFPEQWEDYKKFLLEYSNGEIRL